MSTNDVVCIIGMHRSGTSMVARLLSLCGLDLGRDDELIGPDEGNPLGHFEHAGFHRINEALLKYFGGSWDNPPELNPGWENDSSLSHLTAEAKQVVGTFTETPLWGWKEPRSTLLLPFWKSIIPGLRFIICVRSPLDVARSLERRDGISIGAGASLWHRYFLAAVRDTEGSPRIFTFYEDYFGNPFLEINRVAQFCGLFPSENDSELHDAIFRELRHHASETANLFDAEMIPAHHKLFYLCLRALSSQKYAPPCSSRYGSNIALDLVGKLLDLLTEIEDQEKVAQLQSVLARKEQELTAVRSAMRKQLNEKEHQVFELEEQMNELQKHNLRLQAFSDAVRGTWAYRFYKVFLSPFKPAK
jgi:hypothetical protein